jgi:PAS domain S-box-containing protein
MNDDANAQPSNDKSFLSDVVAPDPRVDELRSLLGDASSLRKLLLEACPEAIGVTDPDGNVIVASRRLYEMTGVPPGSVDGWNVSQLYADPADRQAVVAELMQRAVVHDRRVRMLRPDGSAFWAILNANLCVLGDRKLIIATLHDHTDSEKAELARAHLASIVESSDDAIIGKDLSGIVRSWNAGATRMYGYTAAEMIGKTVATVVPRDQWAELTDIFARVRRGEAVRVSRTQRLTKDGRGIQVALSVSPIRDSTGAITGISTIARDVTTTIEAENKLRAAGAYNRSLIEASLDPLVTIDAEGKITDVNAATEKVTGFARDALIGTDFSDYFTQPDQARAGYLKVFREGSVQDYPLSIRHRDGTLTPVLYNASVYRNERGGVIGVFAAARDDTERQRAQATLQEHARVLARSEQSLLEQTNLLRSVLATMTDGLVVLSHTGEIVLSNPAAASILRIDPSVHSLRSWMDGSSFYLGDGITSMPPADLPHVRAMRGEALGRTELLLRNDAATQGVWLSIAVMPLLLKGGSPQGGLMAFRDISTEKVAETSLRLVQRDFRQVIENLPDTVAILRQGRLVYINRAGATCLRYDRLQDLAGTDLHTLVHPDDRPQVRLEPDPSHAPSQPVEVRFMRGDGETVTLELSPVQTIQFEGQPAQLLVARDVTERNRLRAGLLMADRMASMGTLAAGMAHEINTPLGAIMANLDHVAEEFQSWSDQPQRSAAHLMQIVEEPLREARESADRVRHIVRDLRSFSRAEDMRGEPMDVNAVVESAIRMARNEFRHRARLEKSYQKVPAVLGNAAHLAQVIVNLLINAAHALPDHQEANNTIGVSTFTDEAGRAVIAVRDTGVGIPPEALGRIFDPFFTTKPVGVGTGLGLSISHRIVSDLGGKIHVESRVGVGTTFFVLLPPAAGEVAQSAPPVAVQPTMRPGRVLVIDDDRVILVAISRALARYHDVVALADAREALEMIGAGERFDAIVCDLMMPLMTGMAFHSELQRGYPEMARRTIFLTGGAFSSMAREFLAKVPNRRIEKPCHVDSLRALIHSMMTVEVA